MCARITFVFPPERAFCGMTFMLFENRSIMGMLLPRPCIPQKPFFLFFSFSMAIFSFSFCESSNVLNVFDAQR